MVTTKHSSLFHSHFLIFLSKTDLAFQSYSILFSLGTTHCFSKTCGHMDEIEISLMPESFEDKVRALTKGRALAEVILEKSRQMSESFKFKLPAREKELLEEIKSSILMAEALLAKSLSDSFTAAHAFHSDHVPDDSDFVQLRSETLEELKSRTSQLGLIIKEFDLVVKELCLIQRDLEEKQKSIRWKRNALRKEHRSFIKEVEALHPQLQKEVETLHNECLFELEKLVESASIFSTLLAPLEEDHVTERIVGIEEREMTMMVIQPCEA